MVYFFLVFSAGSFGWFAREVVLLALVRFSRHQQTARLKNLMGPPHKSLPFQTLLSYVEIKLTILLNMEFLKKYFDYLSRQLQRMNHPHLRPISLLGYQILLAFGGALFLGMISQSAELSAIAFLLGALLPIFWIRDKALGREKQLLRELPNSLEILSLCSEAGLSLEQAMDQYLRNSKLGPLKDEFSGILEQTRSGSSRKNALESVSARLDLTDFSLFSTSLIQAERFGTGISKTLRQLSLTMRDKQSQRAEKAVQEMPVKMLIPLILFIMPVTFLIIFGPIFLQFLNQ